MEPMTPWLQRQLAGERNHNGHFSDQNAPPHTVETPDPKPPRACACNCKKPWLMLDLRRELGEDPLGGIPSRQCECVRCGTRPGPDQQTRCQTIVASFLRFCDDCSEGLEFLDRMRPGMLVEGNDEHKPPQPRCKRPRLSR